MYVCVCNAVTERDIGKAVANGCQSLRELHDQLGVGACCGRCRGCAREVLADSLGTRAPQRPAATFMQLAAA